MSFINVFVSTQSRIGIKDNRLCVTNADGENVFPLSDVDTVLIEDMRSTVSAYALSSLAQNKVAVFVCDEQHLPTAVCLPIHSYCRPLAMLELQLDVAKPLKKQLWQSIVKCKIEGQARVLRLLGLDGAEELADMAKSVASDDSGNLEAAAAAFYFKRMLNGESRRDGSVFFNQCLNYGYSIVRGLVARSLAVSGFETSLGLHHCNTLNAFNLADDIMEVYRPLVDLWVCTYITEEQLTSSVKRNIFSLVNAEVIVDDKRYTLSNAVQMLSDSLKRSFAKKTNELCLPKFEEAVPHKYV